MHFSCSCATCGIHGPSVSAAEARCYHWDYWSSSRAFRLLLYCFPMVSYAVRWQSNMSLWWHHSNLRCSHAACGIHGPSVSKAYARHRNWSLRNSPRVLPSCIFYCPPLACNFSVRWQINSSPWRWHSHFCCSCAACGIYSASVSATEARHRHWHC